MRREEQSSELGTDGPLESHPCPLYTEKERPEAEGLTASNNKISETRARIQAYTCLSAKTVTQILNSRSSQVKKAT